MGSVCKFLVGSIAVIVCPSGFAAPIGSPMISVLDHKGSFGIVRKEHPAPILADSSDYPGVLRAASDLQADVNRVTACTPSMDQRRSETILVGTIGKSQTIDGLIKTGKIDVSPVKGKWESFVIQVVSDPVPGVKRGLVIAGSDKRGTIYGIYELSEQIGVSPWYWWADVPVRHQESLFVRPGRYVQGPPAVKYRGIFLNDEAPSLSNWVYEKFGNYNHLFYTHVFELLLRLRANYLWPAMWNNCFSEDDPLNLKLADEYGIVMGTSHVEPMMRADKEWNRKGFSADDWNFEKRPEDLKKFWTEGVERNKPYENIITVAMRGKIDTPMSETANIALLEKIVKAQREIIATHVNPDLASVPQLWCLYKEVQEYYEKGMRVPDDVTLLWADDNWGDIRRLPTGAERNRSGGAGVYYHLDYVGGPRNYKWIDTNPIPKIWEQMNPAYTRGADRIWVVNVGDLKPMEFPLEFFLTFARNPSAWPKERLGEFTKQWAAREFGDRFAPEIADIVSKTLKYNGRRKPELLEPGTYSLTNYREADRVVADYQDLVRRAETIQAQLPENARDAFFQLVLHPAKAAAIVNELYVAVAKNHLYAKQGRASANRWASRARELFQADADLTKEFHALNHGKWNHMMDQTHIGYTGWQQPDANVMPAVESVVPLSKGELGVATDEVLTFDRFNRQTRTIDLFNRGATPVQFSAKVDVPWIRLGELGGELVEDRHLKVEIDWSKAPRGMSEGTVTISQPGGPSTDVQVKAFNPEPIKGKGFVESDGYVSIEPEHFTRKDPGWEKIPDYGRTLSGMSAEGLSGSVLEYRMYLFDKGTAKVKTVVGPSLHFDPSRSFKLAVSFDDEKPQLVDVAADYLSRAWEESVKDNARVLETTGEIATPGWHTLKIRIVDPGVVIQKILVDMGGLKPSYLGPPESFFNRGS